MCPPRKRTPHASLRELTIICVPQASPLIEQAAYTLLQEQQA
jgi:hypothetical protein